MAGRLRLGVVIVVPAFAEGEDRDPEAVGGVIMSKKALRAPHVRGRVYKPGGMETVNGAEEDDPHQERPATDGQEDHAESGNRDPVPLAEPNVEFIFAKIGDKVQKLVGTVVDRLTGHDPTHMGP